MASPNNRGIQNSSAVVTGANRWSPFLSDPNSSLATVISGSGVFQNRGSGINPASRTVTTSQAPLGLPSLRSGITSMHLPSSGISSQDSPRTNLQSFMSHLANSLPFNATASSILNDMENPENPVAQVLLGIDTSGAGMEGSVNLPSHLANLAKLSGEMPNGGADGKDRPGSAEKAAYALRKNRALKLPEDLSTGEGSEGGEGADANKCKNNNNVNKRSAEDAGTPLTGNAINADEGGHRRQLKDTVDVNGRSEDDYCVEMEHDEEDILGSSDGEEGGQGGKRTKRTPFDDGTAGDGKNNSQGRQILSSGLGRPITFTGDPMAKDLTEDERRRLKRRIANRESARRVRQKRQELLEELQQKVTQMTHQNARLLTHIASAEHGRQNLQSQVILLRERFAAKAAENNGLIAETLALRKALMDKGLNPSDVIAELLKQTSQAMAGNNNNNNMNNNNNGNGNNGGGGGHIPGTTNGLLGNTLPRSSGFSSAFAPVHSSGGNLGFSAPMTTQPASTAAAAAAAAAAGAAFMLSNTSQQLNGFNMR